MISLHFQTHALLLHRYFQIFWYQFRTTETCRSSADDLRRTTRQSPSWHVISLQLRAANSSDNPGDLRCLLLCCSFDQFSGSVHLCMYLCVLCFFVVYGIRYLSTCLQNRHRYTYTCWKHVYYIFMHARRAFGFLWCAHICLPYKKAPRGPNIYIIHLYLLV